MTPLPTEPCVLVVDDEPGMRAVATLALRTAGFRVLAASSGEEALLMLLAEPAPVRVLVTDIVMPGMSGSELAAQVVAVSPETRVLYMSGYGPAMVRAPYVPGSRYLGKPFAVQELLHVVAELAGLAAVPKPAAS
ncbi:MAG: response regulator [Myxococcota bacterium]